MSAIELIGISKHYGGFVAIHKINLHVQGGELVTLLGPSGSGKSTLLSMIAGLTKPSTGRIRIGGKDVTDVPSAQRNLGMVFQSYALFPHMSVFENVAFPLRIRGMKKGDILYRVGRALERVRLIGLEGRLQTQLSGGQQQRVALARALVFEPDILLLDEPMGALDKKLREEVQLELRQLQRELGITTIMVTHDQEEALSLSQRIVVLDKGNVQQVDSPANVYQRPRNEFVAQFIGTANLLKGMVDAGNSGRVILPDGQWVPCASDHGHSGHVQLSLRPEHLQLLPAEAQRGISARVVESVYFGQTSRIHLRTDSDIALVAIVDDQTVAYAPGQNVRVAWDPINAWVLST